MADNRLSIYTRIPIARYNASMYYRLVLPLFAMEARGFPVVGLIDNMGIDVSNEERWYMMSGAEFNWAHQVIGQHQFEYMRETRSWEAKPDSTGNLRYPPSFVCGLDDDLWNVMPFNGAFKELGYKDHLGNELPDDAVISYKDEAGKRHVLWEGGKNVNYADNKLNLDYYRQTMAASELIVTTTTAMAKVVEREIGPNDKTFIYPNCINMHEFPRIELRPHPDEVRIMWQGSQSHHEDVWEMREVIGRVMNKYPHAKFIVWGHPFKWLGDFVKPEQFEFISWCPYMEYKLRSCTIGADIALAPLRPSVFNESRSAIKWYEASVVGQATLASNFGVYAEEIQEGETGLLYSNDTEFETKLGGLIEDATLRKRLASNALDWVRTNRDPFKWAEPLYERLIKVREARKEWPVIPVPEKELDGTPEPKHNHKGRGANANRGKRRGKRAK